MEKDIYIFSTFNKSYYYLHWYIIEFFYYKLGNQSIVFNFCSEHQIRDTFKMRFTIFI